MPKSKNAKQTMIKIWQSRLNKHAVLQVFSKPPKILQAKG